MFCNRKRENRWSFSVRNPLHRLSPVRNIARLHFFLAIWTLHCTFSSVTSDLSLTSLYCISPKNQTAFLKTCWLEAACSARCFQAASPQRGSWRQPAQGKCSFPCDDWSGFINLRKSSAVRRTPSAERNAPHRGPRKACFVGRGGARERTQFSPKAETEFSGLCDDEVYSCALFQRGKPRLAALEAIFNLSGVTSFTRFPVFLQVPVP